MPRYLILRDVADWDEDDLFACMLRAKLCLPRYEGLNWLLSYYDRESGQAMCHMEAPNEDILWEHARFSGLPITSVQVVTTIDPANIEVPREHSEETRLLETGSTLR